MSQNLLIVDDEYDILSWLEELFKFNFDLDIGVYTAVTAMDALELLNQVKFDVVLTDIHMPGMDGITMFEKIKDNWPRCRVVFLTGYRSFDDIHKILKHKDVKLVLKNEEDEVIQQAVRDSFTELRQELELVPRFKGQAKNLSEYLMRREFMNNLLRGEVYSQEMIQKCSDRFGIPILFQDKFLMFFIRIDGISDVSSQDIAEMLETVKKLFRENLPENVRVFLHSMENQSAVLLIQSQVKQEKDWSRIFVITQGAVEYVQIMFRQNYETSLSAVVSSIPIVYTEIRKSITRLRRIMTGYLGSEREVIVHAEKLAEERDKGETVVTAGQITRLKDYLEEARRQDYFQILTECCDRLTKTGSGHNAYARELYYSISVLLLQFINQNQLNEKNALEIGTDKLLWVDEHSSWAEAAQYLFDVSVAIFNVIDEKSEGVLSESALKRINEYIEANLAGDLSLTTLANIGGFNASYLSRLYKKSYKTNISDYILQKRMELAAKLLTTTNLKINDISGRIGYTSAHSFTRAFQNWASGISPAEYRERYRKFTVN